MSDIPKCCCGGKNPLEQLDQALLKYKNDKGTLIPALQEAQNIYGYLSKEVIERISCSLDIPISQIYGVVTFYSQFHLNPRGRNIIRVCQGTACHVRGGKAILKAIEDKLGVHAGETTPDLRYTIETVACIGACGLAPVMMVNDDTHGRLTPEHVVELLDRYN